MYFIHRFFSVLLNILFQHVAVQRNKARHLLSESPSVRLSVCLSHSWVTPKRFEISKYTWHQTTTEACFYFLEAEVRNTEKQCVKETYPALDSEKCNTARPPRQQMCSCYFNVTWLTYSSVCERTLRIAELKVISRHRRPCPYKG